MKHSVLFVCWGNICRSPSAEAVFKKIVKDAGLDNNFFIDSAGTISAHAGEPADARMRKHADKRGYKLDSISRKIDPTTDFTRFDHIIVMDDKNMNDVKRLIIDPVHLSKLSKMTDYCSQYHHNTVPDPYYGGDEGFELVLNLLEDACKGLLETIIKKS